MYKNSKVQGDVGMGQAIAYFTKLGYPVLLPISDSNDYDIVVDMEGVLKKVQVKTGRGFNKWNRATIGLRTLGGNQSWSGAVKTVIDTDIDFLFCYHLTAGAYLIPKDQLVEKANLTLNESKDRFKVQ